MPLCIYVIVLDYHLLCICYVVDYPRPTIKLRGAEEEWESNQGKLDDQLRHKDKQLRMLEEEKAKLRSWYSKMKHECSYIYVSTL